MSEEIINAESTADTTPAPPAETPETSVTPDASAVVSDASTSSQAPSAVVSDASTSSQAPSAVVSDAKKRANRLNAQKSTGPKSTEGKRRSSLNATRHAILAQVIHLPEEEMKAYTEYCEHFVEGLSPVGILETELARTCADLQFRLRRASALEHNMFAIGHQENSDTWETGHPESHAALAMAETLRSANPFITLSIYEQRLQRRFTQTLKELRAIQAERRAQEARDLEELRLIAARFPEEAENIEPTGLGFVCSKQQWLTRWRRFTLADPSGARIDLLRDLTELDRNSREIFTQTLLVQAG